MHHHFYNLFQEAIVRTGEPRSGASRSRFPARIAQAAPRGHAKSTLTSLILPLWCIVGAKRKFIGLVSDTTEQAADYLEFIKAELDVNERLGEDFPEACGEGKTWRTGQIVTRNNIKVKCWGKRKAMRGARHGSRRPDLVICDDLEGDENIDSPQQRDKDAEWFFRALMKIGGRSTVYLVVGTLLHQDSLLAKLLKRPGMVLAADGISIEDPPTLTLSDARTDKAKQLKREAMSMFQSYESSDIEITSADLSTYKTALKAALDTAKTDVLALLTVQEVIDYKVAWPSPK